MPFGPPSAGRAPPVSVPPARLLAAMRAVALALFIAGAAAQATLQYKREVTSGNSTVEATRSRIAGVNSIRVTCASRRRRALALCNANTPDELAAHSNRGAGLPCVAPHLG